MSIDRTRQPLSVPSVSVQHQDLKMRPKADNIKFVQVTGKRNTDAKIKLSELSQEIQTDPSHDIDYERVSKIRASMEAGELHLDPDAIAHALVEDIFQLS